MFERFTDRARRVIVLAQKEASVLKHNYIGTEHILLGLIHEGEGVAAQVLESLGISLEGVRVQVEEIIGRGQQAPLGYIPFTPRAKKVLELSLREALQLDHHYIGTEHILLGLIREGDGVAAQVLVKLGADLKRVRSQVLQLLSGAAGSETSTSSTSSIPHAEPTEREARRLVERGRMSGRFPLAELRRFEDVVSRLDAIEQRLSAVERRVGTGADTGDIDQQVEQVRAEKEAAVRSQDFERAAGLRDEEKRLAAQRIDRQQEWEATHPSLPELAETCRGLADEIDRLRALLGEAGGSGHDQAGGSGHDQAGDPEQDQAGGTGRGDGPGSGDPPTGTAAS